MSLVIFQLLVCGVLGLKRMPVPSALMFPLMAFTAYWGNELSRCARLIYLRVCLPVDILHPIAPALTQPLISFFHPPHRQFRFVGNTLTLENLLSTDVKEMAPDTLAALKQAYELHQDDGTAMELSHRAKQPLIEPFGVTVDGQLAAITEEDEMELGSAAAEEGVEEETKEGGGESKAAAAASKAGAAKDGAELDAKTGGAIPVAATATNGKL